MTLFTIGYEGLDVDAFLTLLSENGIVRLVDIRESPYSRKPGFSKKSLAQALATAGFEYVHMAALGCPRPIRDRYRQDSDWQAYTGAFLNYLATQKDAIAQLAGLAAMSTCALLCYEADYNYCHRSLVADAVGHHAGLNIKHIRFAKKAKSALGLPAVA